MGGRPKRAEALEINLFQAIRSVRKNRQDKKDIIVHFIKRCYESDEMLKVLINKLIPNTEEKISLTGDTPSKVLIQIMNTFTNKEQSASDSRIKELNSI
ncbi:hypothetical protein FJZ33_00065 [Candidatus Poribacteria bacterium]|nr:hypothetical protein [Candidatus Poribacteria bacterium]